MSNTAVSFSANAPHPHAAHPERYFFHYILPAMASQLLTGFFIIVDGFFIGRAMGDAGLAAINILWPLPAVILATGLGIGSGGGVLVAMALGRGDKQGAAKARGNTIILLVLAALAVTVGLLATYREALLLLGATGHLHKLACDYMQVAALLCFGQILNAGLNPLLRSTGATVPAMAITVYSLFANIALDWLFIMVLNFGMAGAALATVAAQITSAGLEIVFLLRSRALPFSFKQLCLTPPLVKKTLLIALSPFGLSLSGSLLIMLNNWQCLAYGGESAAAIYAIISYLVGSLQPLLSGIGEGAQPLISLCSGAGNEHGIRRVFLRALALCLGLSFVLCMGSIALRTQIPVLFGASLETAARSHFAIICAALSLPLWGVVRLFCSYFYARGHSKKSLLFIYGDPLAASPLCLYVLPLWFGINGIWLAAPAAQVLLCAGLLMMQLLEKRKFAL